MSDNTSDFDTTEHSTDENDGLKHGAHDRSIQCQRGVSVGLQTAEIEWEKRDVAGEIQVEHSRGDVRISIRKSEVGSYDTDCSVSVYLPADTAREVASDLTTRSEVSESLAYGNIWVEVGWLLHEGWGRDTPGVSASITYRDGELNVDAVREEDEFNSIVEASAEPTDAELAWIASKLENAAAKAEDYEPVSVDSKPTAESSPVKNTVLTGIAAVGSGGLGLFAGWLVVNRFGVLDAGSVGEPSWFAAAAAVMVFTFLVAVLSLWAVQKPLTPGVITDAR